MNTHLPTADDFIHFKEIVRERLSNRSPRILENPGYVPAAVMILLMNKGGEPCVLVTRRTDKVKTHKGQMSLPGGGYEEIDGDILETAFRETDEEVGIHKDKIDLLGRFDDFLSMFGFHITPFIGAVEYPLQYTFNEDEIDDYLEVPVSIFIDKKYDKVQYLSYQEKEYKVYHYFYNNFEIWGLTAQILTDFAELILKG